MEQKQHLDGGRLAVALAVGIGVGVAVGSGLGHGFGAPMMGVGIGIGVGMAVAAIFSYSRGQEEVEALAPNVIHSARIRRHSGESAVEVIQPNRPRQATPGNVLLGFGCKWPGVAALIVSAGLLE